MCRTFSGLFIDPFAPQNLSKKAGTQYMKTNNNFSPGLFDLRLCDCS